MSISVTKLRCVCANISINVSRAANSHAKQFLHSTIMASKTQANVGNNDTCYHVSNGLVDIFPERDASFYTSLSVEEVRCMLNEALQNMSTAEYRRMKCNFDERRINFDVLPETLKLVWVDNYSMFIGEICVLDEFVCSSHRSFYLCTCSQRRVVSI